MPLCQGRAEASGRFIPHKVEGPENPEGPNLGPYKEKNKGTGGGKEKLENSKVVSGSRCPSIQKCGLFRGSGPKGVDDLCIHIYSMIFLK